MSYDLGDDGRQGLQEDDLLEDAEVDTLVREAIAQALGETQFKHDMVLQWTNGIIEGCLKKLAVLAKPFKYVVTCSLSQKVRQTMSPACYPWHLLSGCHANIDSSCPISRSILSRSDIAAPNSRRLEQACTLHALSGGMTRQTATSQSSGKIRPS